MKRFVTMAASAALIFALFASCSCGNNSDSQAEQEFTADMFDKVYDDSADPAAQIEAALEEAKASGKFVICQVGGNWCKWCLLFADWMAGNEKVTELIDENFVYTHINIYQRDENGKKTYNDEAMAMLGKPSRFGFPVLVVLDSEGNVLHIQDSSYLEDGIGYDEVKVLRFFRNWTPEAVMTAQR